MPQSRQLAMFAEPRRIEPHQMSPEQFREHAYTHMDWSPTVNPRISGEGYHAGSEAAAFHRVSGRKFNTDMNESDEVAEAREDGQVDQRTAFRAHVLPRPQDMENTPTSTVPDEGSWLRHRTAPRGTYYRNEYEDPGSVSVVLPPHAVRTHADHVREAISAGKESEVHPRTLALYKSGNLSTPEPVSTYTQSLLVKESQSFWDDEHANRHHARIKAGFDSYEEDSAEHKRMVEAREQLDAGTHPAQIWDQHDGGMFPYAAEHRPPGRIRGRKWTFHSSAEEAKAALGADRGTPFLGSVNVENVTRRGEPVGLVTRSPISYGVPDEDLDVLRESRRTAR